MGASRYRLAVAAMTFASFIITTFASCGPGCARIVCVREAEIEHARSESLLANILPATIASRLKTRAIRDRGPLRRGLDPVCRHAALPRGERYAPRIWCCSSTAYSPTSIAFERHVSKRSRPAAISTCVTACPRQGPTTAVARLALAMRTPHNLTPATPCRSACIPAAPFAASSHAQILLHSYANVASP